MGSCSFLKRSKKCVTTQILIPFAKETTIPGVSLIAANNIHPLERLFWIVALVTCGGGAIGLIISNWNRYNANPTVVSIQKDFRNWNNMLPSATGCFVRKANPKLVADYIEETWGLNSSDLNYEYYENFTKAVANISYETLINLSAYEHDPMLNKVNLLELAAKVHPKLTGTLVTFDTKRKSFWKLIVTEMGVCFSVNNKFNDLMTFNVKGVDITKANVDESLLKCHYLNGLCYARYDSDPQEPINFYVHSYLDVLHATMNSPLRLGESEELEINYHMRETTSAHELRELTPAQRKCHFDDEPIDDDIPMYSTSLCYVGCRYRLVMKLCGCRPFFYNFLTGKLCNITGLLCVAKHAEYITRPPFEIGCQCPLPCEIITYLPLAPKITMWKSGYFDQRITFRWGILHPTTKFRRDIIFGFQDLVVSLGGTLTLFLGVSFISMFEIFYFALERAILMFWESRAKKCVRKVTTAEKFYRKDFAAQPTIRVRAFDGAMNELLEKKK